MGGAGTRWLPLGRLRRGSHTAGAAWAGLVAGLAGGLLAALPPVLDAAREGRALGSPAELVGALALRAAGAGLDGASPARLVAAGLALHGLVAALWGVALALLAASSTHGLSAAAGLAWGTAYGLALWVLDFGLVVPLVHPALARGVAGWAASSAHLLYGAAAGAALSLLRRGAERRAHRRG